MASDWPDDHCNAGRTFPPTATVWEKDLGAHGVRFPDCPETCKGLSEKLQSSFEHYAGGVVVFPLNLICLNCQNIIGGVLTNETVDGNADPTMPSRRAILFS